MSQPLPTVREIYLPALLPQLAAILVFGGAFHMIWPALNLVRSLVVGAVAYMICCQAMRSLFARHHALGIRAYQARNYADSVSHNLASYEFFTRHPLLDKTRHLLFGVASRNPYRTIALCNAGYSEAMRGDHRAAAQYFVRALELTPSCANAEVGLSMVRGAVQQGDA